MTRFFSCSLSIITAFVLFAGFMFTLVQVMSEQKPRFAGYEQPATFAHVRLDEIDG